MKNRRVEEIKKRIAKRKAEQERMEEERYFAGGDFDSETVFIEEGEKEIHPLFRKEVFLFKVLLSAILVFLLLFYTRMLLLLSIVLKLLQKK